MTTLRRFAVVQSLLLWQGGFLFYASFVVPAGTSLLGATGQGAITARVADALNAAGVVGLGLLALDTSMTRDPDPRRTACRWWAWGVALLCQCLLLYFHLLLDALMDEGRTRVVARPVFRPIHRMYLWATTVQWVAGLLLVWWLVRAWRAEDRSAGGQYASRGRE
jgi:Na+/melibiose symporter-like transporter